ncbi:MAG: hypothetical protein ABI640_16065 [Gammaproteobacteria bacterium]
MIHRLPPVVGMLLALVACGAPGKPQHATLATGLSPASCLAALVGGTQADSARCPGFLRSGVAEARAMCTEPGGKLEGAEQADVWQLDVDDDGHNEFAFELNGNVTCVDAYSLFECGSLGCPKALYTERDGEWQPIAAIFAYGPEGVEITDQRVDGHRTLKACRAGPPCVEFWYYEWRGEAYDVTHVDVRGFTVEFADDAQGLRPLLAATDVKATPTAQAESVGHYDAGVDMAVIGKAAGGFYYVSPCNACEGGFVPASAVGRR